MRYLEESDSQRRKENGGCQGPGRVGDGMQSCRLMGKFQRYKVKSAGGLNTAAQCT